MVRLQESLVHQSRILVADDSCTVRTVLRRILVAANYEVILATDGLEAIHLFASSRPDLVILDIQMPEMDGYSVCDEILAMNQNGDDLPIIFLTKDRANHLAALGRQLGAYLQKPVNDRTLLETVRSLLNRPSLSRPC